MTFHFRKRSDNNMRNNNEPFFSNSPFSSGDKDNFISNNNGYEYSNNQVNAVEDYSNQFNTQELRESFLQGYNNYNNPFLNDNNANNIVANYQTNERFYNNNDAHNSRSFTHNNQKQDYSQFSPLSQHNQNNYQSHEYTNSQNATRPFVPQNYHNNQGYSNNHTYNSYQDSNAHNNHQIPIKRSNYDQFNQRYIDHNYGAQYNAASNFENEQNRNYSNQQHEYSHNTSLAKFLIIGFSSCIIISISWFAYKWISAPDITEPEFIQDNLPYKIKIQSTQNDIENKAIYDVIEKNNNSINAEELLPPPEHPENINYDNNHTHNNHHGTQAQYNGNQLQNGYQAKNLHNSSNHYQPNTIQSIQDNTQNQNNHQIQQPYQYDNSTQQQIVEKNQNFKPDSIKSNNEAQSKSTLIDQGQEKDIPSNVNIVKNEKIYLLLATVSSEEKALSEWKRLKSKYKLSSNNQVEIREFENADGAIFYKLLIGPFLNKAKANMIAKSIKIAKVVSIKD